MINKTIRLSIVAIILSAVTYSVSAQQKQPVALEGLWTLIGERIGGVTTPASSKNVVFKMITSDNRFTNFIVTPQKSVITAYGGIEVESDSVYIEKVEKSMNGSLDGKANRLDYQLENNQLYVKFFLEKNAIGQTLNKWYEEVWIRVEMPKEAKIDQNRGYF